MSRQAVVDKPTPDRFRVAMKASLWGWGLYWPGGGLILLLGGLDLIGIAVTVAGIIGFILMLRSGALEASSSRNMKEFLLERPMYLVAVLAIIVFLAPLFGPVENAGLRLFSFLFVGSLGFAAYELARWCKDTETPYRKSGADQVFMLLGIVGFAAMMVFFDAWSGLTGATAPATPMTVAVANWLNILYPALMLLVARPFRERLHSPFNLKLADDQPVPEEPVQA